MVPGYGHAVLRVVDPRFAGFHGRQTVPVIGRTDDHEIEIRVLQKLAVVAVQRRRIGAHLFEIGGSALEHAGRSRSAPALLRRVTAQSLRAAGDVDALEAGLERFVDFDKPGFHGKAALLAKDRRSLRSASSIFVQSCPSIRSLSRQARM